MQVYNKKIVNAVVMSADITSAAYDVQQIYGVAIQASYVGTPTGTLKLQGSCDPATSYNPGTGQGANPVTNWTDLASPQTLSAAGTYMWNIADIMYNWIRVVYTDGSSGMSTAVLTVTVNAKAP